MNPYPISKEDIEDCCGEIAEDFEDSMDDHEKLVSILDYQGNYCTEHCKTKQVNAFLHHVKEECSSLVSESYMAKGKDQGDKSGMDSVTTPIRMVVDPSMTRFNEILAKEENRIGLVLIS